MHKLKEKIIETQNPFKTLSTKNIYDNQWIQVVEDKIQKPNGSSGIYGTVHFKNFALGIIPLDTQMNTWLVGQYRYPLDEYSWEIPMGGGPLDIAPLESAMRELKEETGLIAKKWELILRLHPSNSVTDELGLVYLAQNLTQQEPDFDDTEILQIKKLPLQDAIQMVLNGEITDAISVAGLLRVDKLLVG